MIYTYDILLNWTKNLQLIEFYEWNLEDDLEHIKKIPIFRVSDKVIKDLLTSKLKIDISFLSKIKNKAEGYFHNDIDIIDYAVIVSNNKKAIALELNNKGEVLYKSAMLLDEEEEVLDIVEELEKTDLKYEVLDRSKEELYLTRREKEIKDFLLKELKKIKSNKEISKLNYLYEEFFSKENLDFATKIDKLKLEIEKDYNDFHNKLYSLLKLTTIKKK